jgi:hypothetical protein
VRRPRSIGPRPRPGALAEAERVETSARHTAEHVANLAQVQALTARGAYVRPSVRAYRGAADGQGKYAGIDFQTAPSAQVVAAIVDVVGIESPVHSDDVASRIASTWGVARVGSRVAAKVADALALAVRVGLVLTRDDFVWSVASVTPGADTPVRSRTAMRVTAERIAPEEIQGAIVLVLQAAGGMTRDELFAEVRQLMGVGRTLGAGFDDALAALTRDGRVGEGSVGYPLRT